MRKHRHCGREAGALEDLPRPRSGIADFGLAE
jgi:hypothetical protein